ncbi:MAG: dihydrofolate reductase family protein [Maritimibacter sp.]|nr:dihydrofolate reductase family protein [Maritimibacter sp.]
MQPIIYDVAVSIDGYISGPDEDISKFAQDGPVVDDYRARLETYALAIMGRRTYEFGYRFGMQPGQNPYPHMATTVFSGALELPDDSEVAVSAPRDAKAIEGLKSTAGGPIYLCGGGVFAGWLLSLGLVDRLFLKRAPIVLGGGVQLFGGTSTSPRLKHIDSRDYGNGYLLQVFDVANPTNSGPGDPSVLRT